MVLPRAEPLTRAKSEPVSFTRSQPQQQLSGIAPVAALQERAIMLTLTPPQGGHYTIKAAAPDGYFCIHMYFFS
jgi:hypothetical protein